MTDNRNQPDRIDDATMDALLRTMMPARHEPTPPADLAARAIAHAQSTQRVLDQQRRQLVRRRWQMRVTFAAAMLLIGVVIGVGTTRIARLQRNNLSSLLQTDTTGESQSDSTLTSSSTNAIWIGGFVLILALAGLAAERAISTDRADPASLLRV